MSAGLSVVFQPIVDLENGRAYGFEALGRVDRRLADCGPVELLDLALRRGRLLEVDRRLRALALGEIARHEPPEGVTFFLNVDTRIFDDPALVPGYTRALLADLGIPPARIVLELCERDPELPSARLAALMRHCGAQGFRLALDDFGAGYASFGALVQIGPEIIKLDKSLVRGIAESALRFQLCSALAGFARTVGMRVVAEGIETQADLAALRAARVGLGQGYLLGVPRPLGTYAKRWRRTRSSASPLNVHPVTAA